MSGGTSGTRFIKNTVLKHISHKDMFYPEVGRDYEVVDRFGEVCLISAIGFSGLSGEMAFIRAVNNLALSGAVCESIAINIGYGNELPEDFVRKEMISIASLTKKRGIRIAGGNTVCDREGSSFSFTITAYGRVDSKTLEQLSEKPKAGDKIVIIGNAGEYGASLITEKRREEMRSRFSEDYMDRYIPGNPDELYIENIAVDMIKNGAIYLHDVSFGGIYRTLLEVSEYSGCGITVRHEDIPIKQSTIEVCEFWNLNPYKLLGTGGLVAVFRGDSENIPNYSDCKVAGELTASKERLVQSERNHTNRSLTMYEEDEIYKVFNS
ncbi:MAG: hypothetical protein IKS48_08315 [Eubacterium sp.]|nr:hypothetical protein [Eubacterium sp.]